MPVNIPDLEKMMDQYGDDILRLCWLYLKDIHLAEDALQDTFIKAYRKYGTYNRQASERTWLISIAMNVCKNYLRTSWFKRVITVDKIDEHLMKNCNNNILVLERDNGEILEQIMNLSPKHKEVIFLYYYQQFKINEIAEILKMKESTVAVRLSRAREKLKQSMERWSYHGQVRQSE
ncbi:MULTISPECIES: sigma-70 family RNA polymerase sigma factor [Dehalobacter]|uniref:RNA polymerase sigma factor n=2 Tax=Dehalobacter restrictus TaxID=55583 RepID=A0ABM5P6E5_DEHRP|nr:MULTISPECIES: sigma-70 family RNA polymerase sigma factor [Dehalobacter]AHF10009.1 RNA polymerase sigma factor [Dehalobacter restrictus DSM 9455]MDJ0305924.1 sigma-70 family RNA polymerase sigma factor [Dehalobacter sp.]